MTAQIAFTPDPAMSYWPTPSGVAFDLVYAVIEQWMMPWGQDVRILEPSAGEGHLAREIRAQLPLAHITCVEPDPERAESLRAAGIANDVITGTLEDYLATAGMRALAGDWEPFNAVVMNPPYTLDGHPEAWAEHVLAIAQDPNLLTSEGVISAVVPRTVITGKSRLVRAVRDLAGELLPCERGAFAPVGAKVSTATVWIEKP